MELRKCNLKLFLTNTVNENSQIIPSKGLSLSFGFVNNMVVATFEMV
jgi:hypothetical protein